MVRTVFKTAEAVARRLVGSIPTLSRQTFAYARYGLARGLDCARDASGGTLKTFAPVDSSARIAGITTGGDGRIYYLEQDVSKVGVLSLADACSAVVPVPVGTYSLTVNTFDAQNGGGSTLGTYSGSVTISPNTNNVINLTLNGVLNAVKLVPKSTSFSGCGGSAQTVYVQGLDADGNIIVAPGGFVDAANHPLTITLSSSHGTPMSTSVFASSGVSTLTYASSFSNYTDTLTATPSGGGVGPVSLPLLDQGCG